jgi:hypothetical protein
MPEYAAGGVRREPSGWAIGFTAFAGSVMLMVGVFHALIGLAALFNSRLLAVTPNYVFAFNTTTWGWAHLLLGIIVAAAGFGVFSGAVWARTVGVIMAILSAVANFAFLPYYPVWAVTIIAVDIAVIWALTTHGRDIAIED